MEIRRPLGLICAALLALVACREPPPAPPAEVHLSISGMHCESCVAALTQALEDVPGALNAVVSLELECARVVVTADPDPDLRPALVEAVVGLGYEAEPTDARCRVPEVKGG